MRERKDMEYIKSKDLKEYLKRMQYELSDSEKATLIFNSGLPLTKIMEELKLLSETTKDCTLTLQIRERIEYENFLYNSFCDGDETVIFHLETKEEEGYEHNGLFKTLTAAINFANTLNKEYNIYKRRVYTDDTPIKDELGTASYNAMGELMSCWCKDVQNEKIDSIEWNNRFEGAYLSMPFPFRKGEIVRRISTGDVGIVMGPKSDEEMEEHHKRVINIYHGDFSDTAITVEFLDDSKEKPVFWHGHIMPSDLEYYEEKQERRKELLRVASNLIKGCGSLEYFQILCGV